MSFLVVPTDVLLVFRIPPSAIFLRAEWILGMPLSVSCSPALKAARGPVESISAPCLDAPELLAAFLNSTFFAHLRVL